MSKNDKIRNWGELAKKTEGTGIKPDKNYNKHLIKPCKMISIIGPTGSGKSNALLEFLSRKNNAFHEIILFTGSTTDEDLYNLLENCIDGIQMLDDINELPELTEYNDCDKTQEKLIIFDDIINLSNKEKIKLQKWFNSARKYGFTCIAMCQNWTDMPIQMRRNTHYIWLFKLKDLNQVKQILKNTNNDNIDMNILLQMYKEFTDNIGQFLNIDMTETNANKRYKGNFLNTI